MNFWDRFRNTCAHWSRSFCIPIKRKIERGTQIGSVNELFEMYRKKCVVFAQPCCFHWEGQHDSRPQKCYEKNTFISASFKVASISNVEVPEREKVHAWILQQLVGWQFLRWFVNSTKRQTDSCPWRDLSLPVHVRPSTKMAVQTSCEGHRLRKLGNHGMLLTYSTHHTQG